MRKHSLIASLVVLGATVADASSFTVTRAHVEHVQSQDGTISSSQTVLDSTSTGNVFFTSSEARGIRVDFDSEPATLMTLAYSERTGLPPGVSFQLEPLGFIEFTASAPFDAQYIDGTGAHVQSTYMVTQLATGAFANIDGSSGQTLQFPAPVGAYRIDFYGRCVYGTGPGFDTLALAVVPEPTMAAIAMIALPMLRRRRG
jgi:hypothetical protein